MSHVLDRCPQRDGYSREGDAGSGVGAGDFAEREGGSDGRERGAGLRESALRPRGVRSGAGKIGVEEGEVVVAEGESVVREGEGDLVPGDNPKQECEGDVGPREGDIGPRESSSGQREGESGEEEGRIAWWLDVRSSL